MITLAAADNGELTLLAASGGLILDAVQEIEVGRDLVHEKKTTLVLNPEGRCEAPARTWRDAPKASSDSARSARGCGLVLISGLASKRRIGFRVGQAFGHVHGVWVSALYERI